MKRTINTEHVGIISELVSGGYKKSEIAAELGISRSALKTSLRPGHGMRRKNIQKLKEMREKKLCQSKYISLVSIKNCLDAQQRLLDEQKKLIDTIICEEKRI